MSASTNMMDGQPPTNDEIKEYVEQILQCSDLEKVTMKMVYNQVYSHYPDFDLAHKKDFIKSTIKSAINLEPTIAQMEKLVKFIEENPEIAKGSNQANNAQESLLTTQKWEAVATELNLMGGANRSGNCWAKVWDVSRTRINHIIADRKSATGARDESYQPYTPEMVERMITLLEGLGIEEIPAESPSARPRADQTRRARRRPQMRSPVRRTMRMRPVMRRRRVVMNPTCPQTKRPSTAINLEPTIAQMEKLVEFLEENPEIATRTDQATNAQESFQTTQKWKAIANELNSMGGANRSGDSWEEFWDVSRSHLNHIIADRKSATGARYESNQPYTPEMMERIIIVLEGLGIEEMSAESPSDDEIKNYVMQILEGADLEQLTMKMVCEQVYSHYPDSYLAHKKDFIKAIVKSCI